MVVRGAPLIGVTGAYGLMLGIQESLRKKYKQIFNLLLSTRPTAVNLKWALERVYNKVINAEITDKINCKK